MRHTFQSSRNVVSVIKSRRLRWPGHAEGRNKTNMFILILQSCTEI